MSKKRTTPSLPAEYSAVALMDPKWAAIIVREAKAATGDRRKDQS